MTNLKHLFKKSEVHDSVADDRGYRKVVKIPKCPSCQEFERACAAHFILIERQPEFQQKSMNVELYQDWQSLSRSAQNGCHLCRCWVLALLAECPSLARQRMLEQCGRPVVATSPITTLSPLRTGVADTRPAHYFTVSCGPAKANMRLGGVSKAEFRALTSHNRSGTFNWASARLKACHEGHDVCKELEVSREMPTRLLQMEESGMLRVVDGTDLPFQPYVALSYCWGGDHKLKLSSMTEASLRIGVSEIEFSQTIRDASVLCRQLKIQYLWVDALCIMQDAGSKDWDMQAARIQRTFGNAYFTLSVCSSDSAADGFLKAFQSTRFKHDLDFKACSLYGMLPVPARKTLAQVKAECPLSTRGWIFQEDLLSPRTLYWSQHGLFWSCSESQDAENGTARNDRDELFPQLAPPAVMNPHQFRVSQDPVLLWDDMITMYSSRDFTKAKDRLPAVTGLAELIVQATSEEYLSGLWRSRLPAQLLWEVVEPAGLSNAESDMSLTRPPSWSWASIAPARRIHMPKQASNRARLLDVICKDGLSILHLRGRVRGLTAGLRRLQSWPVEEGSALGPRFPELAKQPTVLATNEKTGRILICLSWTRPVMICLDGDMPLELDELVCFEVNYVGLLLLQPLSDGLYRRVGCAQCHREAALFDGAKMTDISLV